ncbi:MAG: hypothetical protein RLZZ337_1399, partial [Bacteroidota bacterium]
MGTNVDRSLRVFVFFIVVFSLAYVSAAKGNPPERAIARDIAFITQILDQNKLQKQSLGAEMAELEFQVAAAKRVISIIEGAEKVSDYELNKLEQQLNAIEREHTIALAQYQVILVEEYKNRDYRTKLYFLASSNSFGEFINRLNYLEKLKEFRKKQLFAIETKKREIGDKLAVYNGSSRDKDKISALKLEEIIKLNELLSEKHIVFQGLEEKVNALQLQLNQAQSSLNKEPMKTNLEQPAVITSGFNIKKMVWPLKRGLLVGQFGVHKHSKQRKVQVENNGIDILSTINEPVRCVSDGQIKAILEIPGSNTSIIIDHKTHYTVYSNLNSSGLAIGDSVSKEQVLGKVAQNEEGVYKLHFEIWQGTNK